ncbi:serine hydrolase domain-containing protein [Leifsonia naganoensis]|uniref:CubicO group peptidase (Beta-lactamase class C family) n=1 Tax=Leifsonia naganoensis TaxID=150025 RepID=A0A853DUK0_9MICO|nr:serine hydrolase domain-containing protein [Leifsonia naganoensis]NYK10514.1 CubicO group peptidase (beta-lactamase class C family) [Leifsonia naganoensis]
MSQAQARAVNNRTSTGTVANGFEPVRNELDAYLLADPGYSAQLAIYHRGQLVVDLRGGAEFDDDSITGVFSATKGAAALTVATMLGDGRLSLDVSVSHYWPEFAANGKSSVTIRQLLSHQAGVVGVDGGFAVEEILDSRLAAERLAAQTPYWYPGSAFGYHGITIGVLMEELARRVDGRSLQEIYEAEIRAPHDIDFYLGLPGAEDHRYRQIRPAKLTAAQAAEGERRPWGVDTLSALTLNTLGTSFDPADSPLSTNHRAVREAGPAAVGGTGSAAGLAKLYAVGAGQFDDGFADTATLRSMAQQQSWGHDRTLDSTMSYGIIFQLPMPRMDFGSYLAFGHDGAGGALGFADPVYELGFGYIPLPMQYPGGSNYPGGFNPRPVRLSQIARECATRLSR